MKLQAHNLLLVNIDKPLTLGVLFLCSIHYLLHQNFSEGFCYRAELLTSTNHRCHSKQKIIYFTILETGLKDSRYIFVLKFGGKTTDTM